MSRSFLIEKFEAMGARVMIAPPVFNRWQRVREVPRVTLNVAKDRRGEFFIVRAGGEVADELEVLDLRRDLRHLLLLDRDGDEKHRFLCGHDERHWFVAAIPEAARVGTVEAAFEALQPGPVVERLDSAHVRRDRRHRRRNGAFTRQGEWFFVPEPGLEVPSFMVLHNEPLSRGINSTPHRMEFAFRRGGEPVYVCRKFPAGLPEEEYRRTIAMDARLRAQDWRLMVRDPEVYARGRVRHPDHATVHLGTWHRVYMNTEDKAVARRSVVFLD